MGYTPCGTWLPITPALWLAIMLFRSSWMPTWKGIAILIPKRLIKPACVPLNMTLPASNVRIWYCLISCLKQNIIRMPSDISLVTAKTNQWPKLWNMRMMTGVSLSLQKRWVILNPKQSMNASPRLTNSISTNQSASCVDWTQKVNGVLHSIHAHLLTAAMIIVKEQLGNGLGLCRMM